MAFICLTFELGNIFLLFLFFSFSLEFSHYCWNFSQTQSLLVRDGCSGGSVPLNYQPINGDKYCTSAGCTLGSRGSFQTQSSFHIGHQITIGLWILSYGNSSQPLPVLRLAQRGPPISSILQIDHTQSNGSFSASCSSDRLELATQADLSLRSLFWQQIFVLASTATLHFEIIAFDTSAHSSDFITRSKTTSDCFGGLSSQSQALLFIGGTDQPWSGIIKHVDIFGNILSLNELRHLLVNQNYPQLLFKGNYIGAKNEIDVQFQSGQMKSYSQSTLSIRDHQSAIIDSKGRICRNGKPLSLKGFSKQSSLFIEAWFYFTGPQEFFPFKFSPDKSSLQISNQSAILVLDGIPQTYDVPLFQGWNYIAIQNLLPVLNSQSFVYFVINSFVSPSIDSLKGLVGYEIEVAAQFTGHLNGLRLSFDPRGRLSFFFIGRETPLCRRTQFYDGKNCQDCHYTCPYCASLADAFCFVNSEISSLFSMCPSGYDYIPELSYCKPAELCLEYDSSKCLKCASNLKLRAGKCVSQCQRGEIETRTQCRFAIGFESARLVSRNVLVLQYKEQILTNDELFAFLSSEIQISFTKSLAYRIVLLSPRLIYSKEIQLKVQILDVIYQGALIEMEL